jgi:FSR family fosmidomycin resistance protein-like MFS transporter
MVRRGHRRYPLLWLGLAHGVADGAAGWLLGQCLLHQSPATAALGILLYNALGFGGQALVGPWVDRYRCPRATTLAALVFLTLALGIPVPVPALALAGLGSACFHPGAGAIATRLAAGRTTALGMFTAPGILGLTFGTVTGVANWPLALPIGIALLTLALGIGLSSPATQPKGSPPTRLARDKSRGVTDSLRSWQEGMLVLLVGAIAVRSALWLIIQVIHQQAMGALIVLGIAAALGKGLGGYGRDLVGSRRWLLGALIGATLCLPWPYLPLKALGVALLQSTVPLAWQAVIQCLPQQRATAAGLTLGLAVAIGGLWLVPGLVITGLNLDIGEYGLGLGL